MKQKRFDALLTGIICACAFTVGPIVLVMPKSVFIALAGVITCISIAGGILLPNPVSLLSFFGGILMMVLPSWLFCLAYICLCIAGMVINPINWSQSKISS